MYQPLLDHIRRYVTLSPREEELLCGHLEYKKLKKKEFLLEGGKVCKGGYFIVSGCVRQYFVNQKLNEQIINFALENWWISDYDSVMNEKPALTSIQTIEATELILLPDKAAHELYLQIPPLETYSLIMMQTAFVAAQRRLSFMFNFSDEERYRNFSSRYPDFMQRVPQYMLASYLGFTPQFMSRLRAKKI